MNIGDLLINNISGVAIGAAVAFILGKIIPSLKKYIKDTIYKFKQDVTGYIKNKVKDPEIRQLIMKAIFIAQKKLKGVKGKEKFKLVRKKVLDACPDILDKAVDGIIQGIYDEISSKEGF